MSTSTPPPPRLTLAPEGARVNGALVRLTRAERSLLAWLVAHVGEPQSPDRLLQKVWQYESNVSSRTVFTTISRLRAKLEGPSGYRRLIRTVRGGYVLELPDPDQAVEPSLLGRPAELGEVVRWLRSGGRLLLVTGAAGVGKSALVDEAVRQTAAADLPPVSRIDLHEATVSATLDALEPSSGGVLWLDDADPVLAALGPGLTLRGPRLVITCRYRIDHPQAARIHLDPLPEQAASQLLDRWLETRFPEASPSRVERGRWVAEAAGNPARLRRILWSNEGCGPPPGLARHETEVETLRWGLRGLPDSALAVLRRMAAAPSPVDDDAAAALLGCDPPRPVLASLRARGLVDHRDGCWSVPPAARDAVEPDPDGLEALRAHVIARVLALGDFTDPSRVLRLAAWSRSGLALMTWAASVTENPAQLAELVQGVDRQSTWAGSAFDSRPVLRAALVRLPEARHHWWILRQLANAEIRSGTPPDDVEVQRGFETSVALAAHEDPASLLCARHSWGWAVFVGGQPHRASEIARQTCELAREHRHSESEGDARMLEAMSHLQIGRFDRALWCARAAMGVNSLPTTPWWRALSLGHVLSEVGRSDEGRQVWTEAIARLNEAGRAIYTVRLEVELRWSEVAWGTDPQAVLDPLSAHYTALLGSHPPQAAVAALYLAATELLCERPDVALRWLRRATVLPIRNPEVRAVGAAAHTSLGLPIRWDELPPAGPEADPTIGRIPEAFAHVGSGSIDAAREAAREIEAHPGRMARVLGRVLARLVGS